MSRPVSRPQPRATPPWLLRGLLVLLALTGLGVWQGGHCIGDPSHHPVAAGIAAASATDSAAEPHATGSSSTAADNCSIAPSATTLTTTASAPTVSVVERAAPPATSARAPSPRCFAPEVTLIRLGISRT